MYTITTEEGQTLADISLQEYCNPDGILYLVEDNPTQLTSLNDDLVPGMVLNIRDTQTDTNQALRGYANKNGIMVNSGEIAEGGGIDFDDIGDGEVG